MRVVTTAHGIITCSEKLFYYISSLVIDKYKWAHYNNYAMSI